MNVSPLLKTNKKRKKRDSLTGRRLHLTLSRPSDHHLQLALYDTKRRFCRSVEGLKFEFVVYL